MRSSRRLNLRRRSAISRKPGLESLELRQLMAAQVFLDFGDSYPLDSASGEHRFDIDDLNRAEFNAPNTAFPAGTFRSLADALADRGIDYNSDSSFNAQDAIDLGADVLTLVQRYFEPFDVQVSVVDASDDDDIRATLDGSSTNDSYVLFGGDLDFNGVAQVDVGNNRDNVCFAFTDRLLDRVDNDPERLAMALAHTAAHEAGHTFGLRHLDESPTADQALLTTGDVMDVDDATRHSKLKTFSRIALPMEGGGTQNSFLVLGNTLGLKSNGPAYVTGTGAHNTIVVEGLEDNQAEVTVRSFRSNTYAAADLFSTTTFTIDTSNGILVEGGFGDDHIEILNFSGNTTLRGGQGNDLLFGADGGRDRLQGDHGDDFLAGRKGDDVYVYHALRHWDLDDDTVNDLVTTSTDTLDFANSPYAIAIDLASKNLQTVERTPTQTAFINGQFVELPVVSFDPHVKIKLGEALFSTATTIEKVVGSSFSDVIRGNEAANVLSGRGGNDVLEGRGGDDNLSGGAGNDTYAFRGAALGTDTVTELTVNGTDTLDFSGFSQAVALNLGLLNSNQTVNAGNLVLRLAGQVAVENVKGTSFNDVITGNSRTNVLEGGAGNDILRGAAGSDTLRGGEGNDELYGETGLDRLFGDAGDDRLEGGFDGLLDGLTGGAGIDSFVSYHRRRPIQINGIDAVILVLAEADQRLDFNSAEDRVLRMIVT